MSDLAQRIQNDMKDFKATGISRVHELAQEPGALAQYEQLMNHPDPAVRQQVTTAAAYAHVDRSVRILSNMVADPDENVGREAVRGLYANWNGESLQKMGGVSLKRGLIERLQRNPGDGRAILLLSSFRGDSDVLNFAAGLRKLQALRGVPVEFDGPRYGSAATITDLTLALLQAPGATNRLKAILAQGSVADAVAFLDSLSFIQDPAVLRQLTDLLSDERPTGRFIGTRNPVPM